MCAARCKAKPRSDKRNKMLMSIEFLQFNQQEMYDAAHSLRVSLAGNKLERHTTCTIYTHIITSILNKGLKSSFTISVLIKKCNMWPFYSACKMIRLYFLKNHMRALIINSFSRFLTFFYG